jgi:predicted CoA-substrate-specific enzyme activase
MISVGIDIGSRTVKLIALNNGELFCSRIRENSFQTLSVCEELLGDLKYDAVTATGYGRHLFESQFGSQVISEIKAFSIGAKAGYPSCRTILDIGGQDIKVVSLDASGHLLKFEMNDKCSAGTGRFLEIMAMALGCQLSEFGEMALGAEKAERINSMCTVFAESEVVSLISRGAARKDVALGIHQAVVAKAKSMLNRIQVHEELLFVGGVARNHCMKHLLEETLGMPVSVPADPQMVGAYGCALFAMNREK